MTLFQVIEPRAMNKPVDTKKLARFKSELVKSLDFLESYFLKDRRFLCGDDITLADLLCVCELQQPLAAGFNVYNQRPLLQAWMERVRAHLQPHFDDASKMVVKLQAMMSANASTDSADSKM